MTKTKTVPTYVQITIEGGKFKAYGSGYTFMAEFEPTDAGRRKLGFFFAEHNVTEDVATSSSIDFPTEEGGLPNFDASAAHAFVQGALGTSKSIKRTVKRLAEEIRAASKR